MNTAAGRHPITLPQSLLDPAEASPNPVRADHGVALHARRQRIRLARPGLRLRSLVPACGLWGCNVRAGGGVIDARPLFRGQRSVFAAHPNARAHAVRLRYSASDDASVLHCPQALEPALRSYRRERRPREQSNRSCGPCRPQPRRGPTGHGGRPCAARRLPVLRGGAHRAAGRRARFLSLSHLADT